MHKYKKDKKIKNKDKKDKYKKIILYGRYKN